MILSLANYPGTSLTYPDNLDACVRKVLGGEYEHPNLPDYPPVRRVLDIGANVGAFAVWAFVRWPGCWIDCYEPNPRAAEMCEANAPPGTKVHAVAVSARAPAPATLYMGTDWGYSSVFGGLNPQTGETVQVPSRHPTALPQCDALKVDAEGVEVEILSSYPYLSECGVVMFEWHREEDRRPLEAMCVDAGLRFFACRFDRLNMGQEVWIRSKSVFDMNANRYVV